MNLTAHKLRQLFPICQLFSIRAHTIVFRAQLNCDNKRKF